MNAGPCQRPPTWSIVLAFALVYLSWGTTYLAIKEGVRSLPPALFGGTRITLAGLLLLGYLACRGEPLRLPRREWLGAAGGGVLLFVCGNGLISVAQRTVDSGVASILVSTTPLWIALLEGFWPHGDRLTLRGWLGILAGLGGVVVLLAPRLKEPATLRGDAAPLLVLGSAFSWGLGSLLLRHRRPTGSHLTAAAWQMLLGGAALSLVGLALGEAGQLTPERFTPAAVYAFFHLLIVGSLIGFLSYSWLLQHVSAALAGTYAYVNPLVAILIGWLLGGEEITVWLLGGMVIILAGVFLVRSGGVRAGRRTEAKRGARPEPPHGNGAVEPRAAALAVRRTPANPNSSR
jgi:drug/metabolite transporter (DMT)-like permease